jgi:hypothetical protein
MKAFLCIIALVSLNACVLPEGELDDFDVESREQELQTCTATCEYPTYNGVPVSCSTNIYCLAYANGVYCDTGGTPITKMCSTCGNGACNTGETPSSCAIDCGCGNGLCDNGETIYSCPNDCSYCGDGYCDPGEYSWSCPEDCGPYCGDGLCTAGEYSWCFEDCGFQCLLPPCPIQ